MSSLFHTLRTSLTLSKPSTTDDTSSSFTASKLNSSTYLIIEDEAFNEGPYIYAKQHPRAPILILNDTGCNTPSRSSAQKRFVHLKDFLEQCPLECNQNRPLNPPGPHQRRYVIICSHCHYDHTLGLPQFQARDDTVRDEDRDTWIIASAAGRDFIENNLSEHGLFEYLSLPTPEYTVTHWAEDFEKLAIPCSSRHGDHAAAAQIDLGITLIQLPGHTPDSLAWYDHDSMHLFVGDTLYEEGESHTAAIIWPPHGSIVAWASSVGKALAFVRTENERASVVADVEDDCEGDEWTIVERRVKLGAGHITSSGDAEELLTRVLELLRMVLRDEVPVVYEGMHMGELYRASKKDGYGMYFSAPVRLMDEAKRILGDEIW